MSENTKMMYEQIPAIGELNKVDGFDPRRYMRTIEDGRQYLDVQFRMLWFRLKYPEGKVTTKLVSMNDKFAVVEARVYLDKNNSDENYISSAMAQRWFQPENQGFGDKYVECAETAAIGRSLSRAGFGLQFCDVEDEKDPNIVDSPLPAPNTAGNGQGNANAPKTPAADASAKPPANTAKSTPPASNAPAKTETPAAAPPNTNKKYDASTPVDEICGLMALSDAKSYIVGVGIFKGKTLGQIAIDKPSSLEWYVNSYNGPDNILRAGAKLLITTAAQAQAS